MELAVKSTVDARRPLQINLENNLGRYLQMMFEKQKSGLEKLKVASSDLENRPAPSSDATKESPAKSEPEASQMDHVNSISGIVNANSVLETS
ncbi:hypothetical protein DITRI_Ditri05aG0087900 [Diplodiscus trichospermus]